MRDKLRAGGARCWKRAEQLGMPSPRSRASPNTSPASDARPARTPLPSIWGHQRAGRPPGSALCCCQRQAASAPLTAHLGVPGAPLSFLLQPMSPSPSRPCSLEAGTSPEARSPPSGCRPWRLRIPEADRGPPRGWPASCSQHACGGLLEGPARPRRLAGTPLTRHGRPSPRGGPAHSSYGFAAEELLVPGTRAGRSLPRGDRGGPAVPGGGSRVASSFPVAPASTG